jgi:hypothetical protein
MLNIITYSIGTFLGFIVITTLAFWLVRDIVQKKHAVLRNYPIIGHLRYFLENQGEFFRHISLPANAMKCPSTGRRATGFAGRPMNLNLSHLNPLNFTIAN